MSSLARQFGSLFCGNREADFAAATRPFVSESSHPVAGHVRFDFCTVSAGRASGFDCRAGVHDHAGHVHVEVKLHVSDIHQPAASVPELDRNLTLAVSQFSNEVCPVAISCPRPGWREVSRLPGENGCSSGKSNGPASRLGYSPRRVFVETVGGSWPSRKMTSRWSPRFITW